MYLYMLRQKCPIGFLDLIVLIPTNIQNHLWGIIHNDSLIFIVAS
jgi:hypothetical protein